MNKQEQIDEMAVLGCVRNPRAYSAEECAKCDFKQGMCNAYRHAETLYEAGYQKVPEDSVVLSREECERLVNQYKILINELEEENERLREENYIIKSNPPIIASRSVGKTIRAKLIDYDRLKQFNKSLKDRIAEQESEIERLEEVIAHQNKLCWDCKKSVKEFAEKLKERCHNYYPSIDHYCCSQKAVNVKVIDELLKEYEE